MFKFNFSIIKTGNYNITGYLDNDNEILNSNTLNIDIIEDDIENKDIFLDYSYLESIALNNNGKYVDYKNTNDLLNTIETQGFFLKEKESKNILTYKFIWIILICLFLSEWFIRNRIGLL